MANENAPIAGAKMDPTTGAWMVEVDVDITTAKGGKDQAGTYKLWIPATVKDAIKVYGEGGVMKRFVRSLVIEKSGPARDKLARGGKTTTTGRKKAKYLSKLGF